MIRSYDMGYISTRMMECEDTFSDMGSLKQNLELPPEYAYDDGEQGCKLLLCLSESVGRVWPVHVLQSARARAIWYRRFQNSQCNIPCFCCR